MEKENWMHWALVSLVVIALFGALFIVARDRGGLLTIGGRSAPLNIADVDGARPIDYCGRSVSDFFGVGYYNDPDGDTHDVYGRLTSGELFSATRLWYSWFKDGDSRPISLEGRLTACNLVFGFPSPPDSVFYRFSYSTDGKTWVGFAQDRIPEGVFAHKWGLNLGAVDSEVPLGGDELIIDGFEFRVCTFDDGAVGDWGRGKEKFDISCTQTGETRTIADGAALRAQVLVARYGAALGLNNYEPMLVFEDQVELRNAVPELEWSKPGYNLDTDTTAKLEWLVPTLTYTVCAGAETTCTEKPAYFLEVVNLNTDTDLTGWNRTPLTELRGAAQIPLSVALYSNDLETCENRLRGVLWSEVIVVDLADTTLQRDTKIAGAVAPVVSSVSFDKPEYQEGDTVTVSWVIDGNFTRVHLFVHVQGLLLVDQTVDGDSWSKVAPRSGIGEAEVVAYNRCQPSDVKKERFTVGNVFPGLCTMYPDLPQCTGGKDWLGLALAILGVFAVLLVFFVSYWFVSKMEQIPPVLQFLIALGAAVGTALLLIGIGFFDSVLR